MNILLMTSAAPSVSPFSCAEKSPPIGLGFLIAVLKERGHHVWFRDPYLDPSDVPDASYLRQKRIDLVGMYANTICWESTLAELVKLERYRKQGQWNGYLALGGPHISTQSATAPGYVDLLISGEAEITLPAILERGITDRVVVGDKVPDLDVLPMPAYEEFIHRPYHWKHPWIDEAPVFTLNTSRGCPHRCTFCSVQGIWGRNYRAMSAERVLDDLEFMIRYYGMKVAYFREDHFTLQRTRTTEFCNGMLDRGLDIGWICETRADSIDDRELIALMAQSGCRVLYIGVESGSQRILDRLEKGEELEQFNRVFRWARQLGIRTYASIVFGIPGETEEDVQATLRFIDQIRPDFHSNQVFVGIPTSPLYEQALAEGLVAHRTPSGIFYLRGHDALIDRFYGGDPSYKIPKYLAWQRWRDRIGHRLRKDKSRATHRIARALDLARVPFHIN